MPPQLAIIRDKAANRGWQVICQGRSGEEGVVRVAVPSGTSRVDADSFQTEIQRVASSTSPVSAEAARQPGCDRDPTATSGPEQQFALAFGPSDYLAKLIDIAKACGFSKAYVRPMRQGDGPPDIRLEWSTLDAGENVTPRYGPTVCFLNLGITPLMKAGDAN